MDLASPAVSGTSVYANGLNEWVDPRGGMFISAENATGERLAEIRKLHTLPIV